MNWGVIEKNISFGDQHSHGVSGPAALIMAKVPIPGRVKTRLAAGVSKGRAIQLAWAFLYDTVDLMVMTGLPAYLAYSPDEALTSLEDLSGRLHGVFPQEGGDLGDRMWRALNRVFFLGHAPVLIVGTDCPRLAPEDIHQAMAELGAAEVVFGPSTDGGYYLLGISGAKGLSACEMLFRNMPWGTSMVLEKSLEAARKVGFQAKVLSYRNDIDTLADLEQLIIDFTDNPTQSMALHTRRLLADWGLLS